MTNPATPPQLRTAPQATTDPSEGRAAEYARWLHEAAALGMDQMRKVMTAPQDQGDDGRVDMARERDRAIAYDQILRTLRRTMALSVRFEAMAKKAAAEAGEARVQRQVKTAERRREVEAALTPVIEGVSRPRTELDRVWEEFSDWLDARQDDPAFVAGDLYDQAAQACADLKLAVDRTLTHRRLGPPEWSLRPLREKDPTPPRSRIDIRGSP